MIEDSKYLNIKTFINLEGLFDSSQRIFSFFIAFFITFNNTWTFCRHQFFISPIPKLKIPIFFLILWWNWILIFFYARTKGSFPPDLTFHIQCTFFTGPDKTTEVFEGQEVLQLCRIDYLQLTFKRNFSIENWSKLLSCPAERNKKLWKFKVSLRK